MKIEAVLEVVGGLIVGLILWVFVLVPLYNTAQRVWHVTTEFDQRVESASERGATRAIKPVRDEIMQAQGVAQDSLNGIASCIDCKDKKPAPRQTVRQQSTAATTTVTAPVPETTPEVDMYECLVRFVGPEAKKAAERENWAHCWQGPGPVAPPPTTVVIGDRPNSFAPPVSPEIKRCYDRHGLLWSKKTEVPCKAPEERREPCKGRCS